MAEPGLKPMFVKLHNPTTCTMVLVLEPARETNKGEAGAGERGSSGEVLGEPASLLEC